MAALVSYLTLNDFHDALWSCYNKSGVYTKHVCPIAIEMAVARGGWTV